MIKSVCWNLTSECNLNCQYCFRELNEEAQNFEKNLVVLNNLKEMGVERITFSGGEPFLYPKILELIKEAHDMGFTCYIVSNGSLLNADNVRECLRYIDKISFSCDSTKAYINDHIGRGADSYEHVKGLIPEIRKYYGPDRLMIDINTVVTSTLLNDLKEVDVMFKKINSELSMYGISNWKIIRFYPLRGYAKENKDLYWIDDDIFARIKEYFGSVESFVNVDVRDIEDMDNDYIVSPCGILKQSYKGSEMIIKSLRGGANRVQ